MAITFTVNKGLMFLYCQDRRMCTCIYYHPHCSYHPTFPPSPTFSPSISSSKIPLSVSERVTDPYNSSVQNLTQKVIIIV